MLRNRTLAIPIALALAACSADPSSAREPTNGSRPSDSSSGAAGGGSGSGSAGVPGGQVGPGGMTPGVAGQPGNPADGCAAISQTAENRRQPADIIFAVDNSGSMDEEIVFVREQLNAFSQQIVDSGIDVRIILVSAPIAPTSTTPDPGSWFDDDDDQDNGICIEPPLGSGNCPDDSNPPRYLHVPVEVKSHDALNLFVATFPMWQSQLRPNATQTFVVVTDDNAEDEPNHTAAAFTASVAGLDPTLFTEWSFSGIYCFTECPEAAEIGTVYADLVAQTQGVGGDLCLQDFAPVFDALAQSVISSAGIDCQWDIPPPPQGMTFDVDKVNLQYTVAGGTPQTIFHVDAPSACDTQGGWYYDDNTNPTQIAVCPSTCTLFEQDASAQLDVLFGCETNGPF